MGGGLKSRMAPQVLVIVALGITATRMLQRAVSRSTKCVVSKLRKPAFAVRFGVKKSGDITALQLADLYS